MSEAAAPQTRLARILASHRLERVDSSRSAGDDVAYDDVILGLDLAHALLDRDRGSPWRNADSVCYFEDAIDPEASGDLFLRLRQFLVAKGAPPFTPLGSGGFAHAEAIECGRVRPGRIVVGSGGAGYAAGALGALYLDRSPFDLADALERGFVEIPAERPIERVRVVGKPERFTSPTDLAFALAHAFPSPAFGFEIEGDYFTSLEISDRLAFCAMLGARLRRPVVLPVDIHTVTWLRARTGARLEDEVAAIESRAAEIAPPSFDPTREIAIDSVLPSVATGERTDAVVDLDETPIRAVLVGGAFGAQLHDLRLVAHFVREHPVHSEVRFVVVPATVKTLIHAVHEGILGVLLRAGVRVEAPGAHGVSRLQRALLGSSELGLTTACDGSLPPGWRHASASTCVASAILGRIAHPDEVIRRRKESV